MSEFIYRRGTPGCNGVATNPGPGVVWRGWTLSGKIGVINCRFMVEIPSTI